jgi:hypothetical protein
VTVFEEYKKKHIDRESVSGRLPAEEKRNQMVRPHDTKMSCGEYAGRKETQFKPPAGSWEESVREIDMCLENGTPKVCLTWQGGEKTLHNTDQVYKRCPQKVRHKIIASLHICTLIDLDVEVLREQLVGQAPTLYDQIS